MQPDFRHFVRVLKLKPSAIFHEVNRVKMRAIKK